MRRQQAILILRSACKARLEGQGEAPTEAGGAVYFLRDFVLDLSAACVNAEAASVLICFLVAELGFCKALEAIVATRLLVFSFFAMMSMSPLIR